MKRIETEIGHHQEEIQRILDRKPPWIIRWGTVIITLSVVLLIVLAILTGLTDRFRQLF